MKATQLGGHSPWGTWHMFHQCAGTPSVHPLPATPGACRGGMLWGGTGELRCCSQSCVSQGLFSGSKGLFCFKGMFLK